MGPEGDDLYQSGTGCIGDLFGLGEGPVGDAPCELGVDPNSDIPSRSGLGPTDDTTCGSGVDYGRDAPC